MNKDTACVEKERGEVGAAQGGLAESVACLENAVHRIGKELESVCEPCTPEAVETNDAAKSPESAVPLAAEINREAKRVKNMATALNDLEVRLSL